MDARISQAKKKQFFYPLKNSARMLFVELYCILQSLQK